VGATALTVMPWRPHSAAAVLLAVVAHKIARSGAAPGVPALVFAAGFLVFRAANQALRPSSTGALLPTAALVAIYLAAGVATSLLLVRVRLSESRLSPLSAS